MLLPAIATFGARRLLRPNFDNQPSQAELLQARSDAIAAIPQLPKDTEEKLSGALDPQLAPITATFVDPLVDRFGVDRNSKPNAPRLNSVPLSARSVSGAFVPETPDKIARLTQWQQALREANANSLPAPSITTAYLISEVSAAGRIITTKTQSAWLYIDSEKRQIAVNVGAKFYDGVLVSIDRQRRRVSHLSRTNKTHAMGPSRRVLYTTYHGAHGASSTKTTINTRQHKPTSIAPMLNHGVRDYSDLQKAVRDRYADTTIPNTAQPKFKNLSPEQIVLPTRKSTSTQFLTPALNKTPNPFSVNSGRQHKLDYAHAPQTNPRPILNFHPATESIS